MKPSEPLKLGDAIYLEPDNDGEAHVFMVYGGPGEALTIEEWHRRQRMPPPHMLWRLAMDKVIRWPEITACFVLGLLTAASIDHDWHLGSALFGLVLPGLFTGWTAHRVFARYQQLFSLPWPGPSPSPPTDQAPPPPEGTQWVES